MHIYLDSLYTCLFERGHGDVRIINVSYLAIAPSLRHHYTHAKNQGNNHGVYIFRFMHIENEYINAHFWLVNINVVIF